MSVNGDQFALTTSKSTRMEERNESPNVLLPLMLPRPSSSSPNSMSDTQSTTSDPNKFNTYLNRGSELWAHWTWINGTGKMSLMQCNYCLINKQLKNAPKCRRHLIKCQHTPPPVKTYFEKKELEALQASAFMKEVRAKDIKFKIEHGNDEALRVVNKNNDQHHETKPTANDLRHFQNKFIHAATVNGGENNCELDDTKPTANDLRLFQNKLVPKGIGSLMSNNNNNNNEQGLTIRHGLSNRGHSILRKNASSASCNKSMNDLNSRSNNVLTTANRRTGMEDMAAYDKSNLTDVLSHASMEQLYHLMSMSMHTTQDSESMGDVSDTNDHYTPKNGHSLKKANYNTVAAAGGAGDLLTYSLPLGLKRKLSPSVDIFPANGNGHGHTNKENKMRYNTSTPNNPSNLVIINLDQPHDLEHEEEESVASLVPPLLYNGNNGKQHHQSMASVPLKKRRNGKHANLYEFDAKMMDVVFDDLNDILASAFISAGVDMSFVENNFFQKYIAKLLSLSSINAGYNLPSARSLAIQNVTNLSHKFDYETDKLFTECDSIVLCFSMDKESVASLANDCKLCSSFTMKKASELNVHMLISNSNKSFHLLYNTLPGLTAVQDADSEADQAVVHQELQNIIAKVGSTHISAVVLPYSDNKLSSMIYSYMVSYEKHIVPLNNSYKMFHRMLCDMCRVPIINKLIMQCIKFYQELVLNFADFKNANLALWKRVFQSDHLKIYTHLVKDSSCYTVNKHWISLNLMLCWFLVARESIIKLFHGLERHEEEKTNLEAFCERIDLKLAQIESFFDKVSILFHFMTPFINAIHLIENESSVISDIIKIYFDLKDTINKNDFTKRMNSICDEIEQQAIQAVISNYMQDHNFTSYFFLAFYLDPRFREDESIVKNEDMITQVYEALFCYAKSLGCVNEDVAGEEDNKDKTTCEDREKLVDSLDQFRNAEKLYGMPLLETTTSPVKYWKHLSRFPTSSKLAHCACRLFSISTRSMMLSSPMEDACTASINKQVLDDLDHQRLSCKVLPIKSFLLSQSDGTAMDGEGQLDAFVDDATDGTKQAEDESDIGRIVECVFTSLHQYSFIFAQPFTANEMSCLVQTPI